MIYLMRHGLDDETFIGGWSEVDLINEGKKQVEESLNYLEKLNIERIYSSDVKRAITTSNIVSKKLNIPIILKDVFREQNKGLLNGMPKKEADSKYGKYLESKDINLRYPKGESLKDLYDRIIDKFNDIEPNSLIITHRGVINMLYYYLTGTKLDLNKKRFGVDHASIHELDLKNKTIRRIF